MELPPRARRIHPTSVAAPYIGGTTSACAENTVGGFIRRQIHGNYLRVRGEYLNAEDATLETLELPPRARRIPHPQAHSRTPIGTTSACAENTTRLTQVRSPRRNYLRVRGEYLRMV